MREAGRLGKKAETGNTFTLMGVSLMVNGPWGNPTVCAITMKRPRTVQLVFTMPVFLLGPGIFRQRKLDLNKWAVTNTKSLNKRMRKSQFPNLGIQTTWGCPGLETVRQVAGLLCFNQQYLCRKLLGLVY